MREGTKITAEMVFIIHILKRVTGIFEKSPDRIIQINKYTFVHTA